LIPIEVIKTPILKFYERSISSLHPNARPLSDFPEMVRRMESVVFEKLVNALFMFHGHGE